MHFFFTQRALLTDLALTIFPAPSVEQLCGPEAESMFCNFVLIDFVYVCV